MSKIQLSIVIPAYNEETNIRLGVLDKVSRFLQKNLEHWEVIIVNDGSTDATKELIESFIKENSGFRLIDNRHQGKAATVITGMLEAYGNVVLFTDLDQATPIKEIEKILPWFDEGFDVVIGSRSGRREGAPFFRQLMAKGFIFLRTMILGLSGITDTQCGFKAFKKIVISSICKKLKLYGKGRKVQGSMVSAGFDIEVLYLAKKLGYKIKEVPVDWHYVETRRVNPLKDSWQGLLDIIKIRINTWRGEY